MAAAEAARSAERLDAEVLGILKGTESDNESEEVPLALPDSHLDLHSDAKINGIHCRNSRAIGVAFDKVHTESPSGQALNCFYGIESADGGINALEEPEFIEIELILVTGATIHVADRLHSFQHGMQESEGSKAGQKFRLCWRQDVGKRNRSPYHDDSAGRPRV